MTTHKNCILAVAASRQLEKATVQKLRHRQPTGFVSMRAVLVELGTPSDELDDAIARGSPWLSKLSKGEKFPALEALWGDDATPTLATLNTLRKSQGMKELKVWKASRAALVTAIEKLQGSPLRQAQAEVNKAKSGGGKNGHRVMPARASSDTITLAQVAATCGLSPKQARVKARKHKTTLAKLECDGKYRYAPEHRERVAGILRGES